MRTLLSIFSLLAIGNIINAQGLSGEYYITGQGGEIVLRLQDVGNNQLKGTMVDMQGINYQVQAEMEDEDAFGTILNPHSGGLYFEAYLEDGQLSFTLIPPGADGQPDQRKAQEYYMLPRNVQHPQQDISAQSNTIQQGSQVISPGNNFEKDQRIVGNWIFVDTHTSGHFAMVAQQKFTLYPDGTFAHDEGKVAGGGPGVSAQSYGNGVNTGQWRTKDNNTIIVNIGTGWQALCRYETNGSSILMYFNDGSKQLWNRN